MDEKRPLNDGVSPQMTGSPPTYTEGASGSPAPAPGQQAPYPAPYQGQPVPPGGYTQPPIVVPPPVVGGDFQAPAPPPGYDKATGQPVGVVQPPTTVIIQQQAGFSPLPTNCVCPNCQQNVVTSTIPETSTLTWLVAGGIILFGGWICCLCLIPFCIDDLKDVRHVCPNCQHTIHLYRRM